MLAATWFIFYSELLLLWRRSQEWLYPLAFFVIVICLFPIALTPDPVFLQRFVPGCIWIAALLASLLAIENIFYADLEEGCLEQIVLSPLPLSSTLLAKLCAQWVMAELPLILLTPLMGWIFHLSSNAIFLLSLSLLLGTPILTLLGGLGVALTLGLRQQGVLLSLLILPLTIPILIFGVNLVQQSEAGFSVIGPIFFLSGLTFLAISIMPSTIAMALRISFED